MRDIAGEVATDQAVPSGAVLEFKLLLQIRGNVLFKVVVLHSVHGPVQRKLEHVGLHVNLSNDRLGRCHASQSVAHPETRSYEQRKHPSAKYPDSSVDLIGATVDTQKVKFHSTPQVHMGSEDRSSLKNAEILRTNAELAMGMESPGALEYFPKEVRRTLPAYSFARKPESRVQLLQMSTPRKIGPGSHAPATSMGHQPTSPRPNAPAWTMTGKSPRDDGPPELLAIEDKVFSSIGKQVLSTIRSPPGIGVTKSTRDQSNRTALYVGEKDRVTVGPKPTFRIDLPARSAVSRPGL